MLCTFVCAGVLMRDGFVRNVVREHRAYDYGRYWPDGMCVTCGVTVCDLFIYTTLLPDMLNYYLTLYVLRFLGLRMPKGGGCNPPPS